MESAEPPQAPSARQFSIEFGAGREAQSSPLVRISPQGALIYLPGLQRLDASHGWVEVQGFADTPLAERWSASLAGAASLKQAPRHADFDMMLLSLQPGLHAPLGPASVGIGLQWQRIEVARQPFRQTRGVQLSWTLPDGNDHWSALAERSFYRHRGELADLDARASSLMLQRHLAEPLPLFTAIDLAVYLGRERNAQGFMELSQRSVLLQATLQWDAAGLNWSAGVARQRLRFDDTAFADEPQRRDRAWLLDAAAELGLADKRALRLSWSGQFNRSSTRLYENRYRQLGLSLRVNW